MVEGKSAGSSFASFARLISRLHAIPQMSRPVPTRWRVAKLGRLPNHVIGIGEGPSGISAARLSDLFPWQKPSGQIGAVSGSGLASAATGAAALSIGLVSVPRRFRAAIAVSSPADGRLSSMESQLAGLRVGAGSGAAAGLASIRPSLSPSVAVSSAKVSRRQPSIGLTALTRLGTDVGMVPDRRAPSRPSAVDPGTRVAARGGYEPRVLSAVPAGRYVGQLGSGPPFPVLPGPGLANAGVSSQTTQSVPAQITQVQRSRLAGAIVPSQAAFSGGQDGASEPGRYVPPPPLPLQLRAADVIGSSVVGGQPNGQADRNMTVQLTGDLVVDARQLGRVSATSLARDAALPLSTQSRPNIRTTTVYTGMRIPQ